MLKFLGRPLAAGHCGRPALERSPSPSLVVSHGFSAALPTGIDDR
jgi:hypothetical protein